MVNKRARQAVHLNIHKEFMTTRWQELIHTLSPFIQFCLAKNIVQAQHPSTVRCFCKTTLELMTNPLRRTIRCYQARVGGLKLLELSK